MTQYQVCLGQTVLPFCCEPKPRNAKYKMKIIIHPQKGLVVRHARNIPLADVKRFLFAHQDWIEKNIHYFSTEKPVFSIGHFSVPWLGVDRPVSFYAHTKNNILILYQEQVFSILLPADWLRGLAQADHPDFNELQLKLNQSLQVWYKKQARIIFHELLQECVSCCSWVTTLPTIRIKMQKTRWGSCSSLGNINLNAALLQFPKETIKNVIFHELCHLKYQNHRANFYQLLAFVDPDWQRHHSLLKKGRSVLFA